MICELNLSITPIIVTINQVVKSIAIYIEVVPTEFIVVTKKIALSITFKIVSETSFLKFLLKYNKKTI